MYVHVWTKLGVLRKEVPFDIEDAWDFQGVTYYAPEVLALHRVKGCVKAGLKYAPNPYFGPKAHQFNLPASCAGGYVVYCVYTDYSTFEGHEGLLDVQDVLETKEEALQLIKALEAHRDTGSCFKMTWKGKDYRPNYCGDIQQIGYQYLEVT